MQDYADLDNLKDKLEALRPIAPEKLGAVQEKFRLDWTYHSNALEGNPLSLSETSFFIREGLTSKGKPLAAYLEASNHIEALDYLETVVHENGAITEHLVRQYHTMLFNKIDKISMGSGVDRKETAIIGGQYKQQNNHVIRLDGRVLEFADWLQVPGEMERLVKWYNENRTQLHPVSLASQFHHRFVSIHPFLDGNGRVARLLMNTILMQNGYTPAIIPVEEKQRYLEALQAADDGNLEPLHALVAIQVSKSLTLTLNVVEGRDAFDFDDLTRMVQNIRLKAKDIQQELGPATTPPGQRSLSTSTQILDNVLALLREHVNKTKDVNLIQGAPSSAEIQNAVLQIARAASSGVTGYGVVTFTGDGRTLPQLQVGIATFSAQYRVGLASAVSLGRFDGHNHEQMKVEPSDVKQLTGSIYYEDWDTKTIHDFVLAALKAGYQKWESEIERRKTLIAAEEEEVTKHRLRKS